MGDALQNDKTFNVLTPLFTATQVLDLVNNTVHEINAHQPKVKTISMDDWQNWRRQGHYKAYTDFLKIRPPQYCALDVVALSTIVCLRQLGVPLAEAARLSRAWNLELGITLEYRGDALEHHRRFVQMLAEWPEIRIVYTDGDHFVSEPWLLHFNELGKRVEMDRGLKNVPGAAIMVQIKALTEAAVNLCEFAWFTRITQMEKVSA